MASYKHGDYTIEVLRQVMIVRAYGSWNWETANEYCEEYRKFVLMLSDKPWACLVDLSQWELSTPDIWPLIDETNAWANLRNQKYEVVVCSMVIQKYLLERSHDVLTNVETKFCNDYNEALAWLKNLSASKRIILF